MGLARVQAPGAGMCHARQGSRTGLHVLGRVGGHPLMLPAGLMLALSTGLLTVLPAVTYAQGALMPRCSVWRPSAQWTGCVGTWSDAATGALYTGEFRGGVFHGFGLLQAGPTRYVGEFRDGRMHGQGVLELPDGSRYVGTLVQGAMQGTGRLIGPDGREVFSGEFANGVPVRNGTVAQGAAAPPPPPQAPQAPPAPPAPPAAPPAPAPAARPTPPAAPPPPPAPAPPAPPAGSVPLRAGATLPFPAVPRGARTPIEGVFYRQRTFMSMSGSVTLYHEAYFFTTNGKFFRSPSGGVSLGELAAQTAATSEDGSYWIEGNELVMAFSDGRTVWRSPYEGHTRSISIDNGYAGRQGAFARGFRLEGRFAGGSSSGGGATSSSTLTFRGDGTYTRGGGIAIVTRGTTSDVTTGGTSGGAGTYELDGFTLTLRENGTARRFTVFAWGARDGAGRPEGIFYEGVMLTRQ